MHSSRRPIAPGTEFTTPPLLVLNNFGGEERHLKLLGSVFQNMFPPLHVHSMRLSQVRRVVLLNYNADTKTIDWRHYLISVRPVGVSRSVRRVIEGSTRPSSASSGSVTGHGSEHKRHGRALVNLGNATDIAEYVIRGSQAAGGEDTDTSEAESELEDMADPQNAVQLSQNYVGRGNAANAQRAVRLREIGPRMELRLVKVEEGLNGSSVLYHDYVHMSASDVAKQTRDITAKRQLAAERRAEQERNGERKKQAKAEKRGHTPQKMNLKKKRTKRTIKMTLSTKTPPPVHQPMTLLSRRTFWAAMKNSLMRATKKKRMRPSQTKKIVTSSLFR